MTLEDTVVATGGNITEVALVFCELALVLGDPVLVVGDITPDAVVEVAADGVLPLDLELDTAVGDLCEVHCRGAIETIDVGDIRSIEDTGGELVVSVDATGETAVEEAEVETEVGHCGLLPLDGAVRDARHGDTVGEGAAVGIVGGVVHALPGIVAYGVVTELTPGGPELQVVQIGEVLHPGLVADLPTCGE